MRGGVGDSPLLSSTRLTSSPAPGQDVGLVSEESGQALRGFCGTLELWVFLSRRDKMGAPTDRIPIYRTPSYL